MTEYPRKLDNAIEMLMALSHRDPNEAVVYKFKGTSDLHATWLMYPYCPEAAKFDAVQADVQTFERYDVFVDTADNVWRDYRYSGMCTCCHAPLSWHKPPPKN